MEPWVKGAAREAAESSKIAAIAWKNKGKQIRVYYQDPHLCLQGYCYENAHWRLVKRTPNAQHLRWVDISTTHEIHRRI